MHWLLEDMKVRKHWEETLHISIQSGISFVLTIGCIQIQGQQVKFGWDFMSSKLFWDGSFIIASNHFVTPSAVLLIRVFVSTNWLFIFHILLAKGECACFKTWESPPLLKLITQHQFAGRHLLVSLAAFRNHIQFSATLSLAWQVPLQSLLLVLFGVKQYT